MCPHSHFAPRQYVDYVLPWPQATHAHSWHADSLSRCSSALKNKRSTGDAFRFNSLSQAKKSLSKWLRFGCCCAISTSSSYRDGLRTKKQ
jgi:hypothetical protein